MTSSRKSTGRWRSRNIDEYGDVGTAIDAATEKSNNYRAALEGLAESEEVARAMIQSSLEENEAVLQRLHEIDKEINNENARQLQQEREITAERERQAKASARERDLRRAEQKKETAIAEARVKAEAEDKAGRYGLEGAIALEEGKIQRSEQRLLEEAASTPEAMRARNAQDAQTELEREREIRRRAENVYLAQGKGSDEFMSGRIREIEDRLLAAKTDEDRVAATADLERARDVQREVQRVAAEAEATKTAQIEASMPADMKKVNEKLAAGKSTADASAKELTSRGVFNARALKSLDATNIQRKMANDIGEMNKNVKTLIQKATENPLVFGAGD